MSLAKIRAKPLAKCHGNTNSLSVIHKTIFSKQIYIYVYTEGIPQEYKAYKRKNNNYGIIILFSVYKNCAEVYKSGDKISGVYKINLDGLGEFEVFCDQKTAGGGWTVFQKRRDGSVDFFRGWNDYKNGFGNLNGEFWLGFDKIHRLTVISGYKLRVDLEDIHGKTAFAEYSSFSVTSERAKYQLNLGSYSG